MNGIQRPFTTTRRHVVAGGQSVRIEFDKLGPNDAPAMWTQPSLTGCKIVFIAPRVVVFTAPASVNYGSTSFMVNLPGGDNDTVSITINPDYAQGPEQQAREVVLPGTTAGPDPRVAAIEAKWPGLLARLG